MQVFCFLFLLVAQCWCILDMYIAYHLLILLACNCITNSVMCILYLFCMFYNLDSYYQALFLLLLLTSLYLSLSSLYLHELMYHYLFLMSFSWLDSKLVLLKLAYYWFGFPKLCIRYCEIRSEKCAWGILRLPSVNFRWRTYRLGCSC